MPVHKWNLAWQPVVFRVPGLDWMDNLLLEPDFSSKGGETLLEVISVHTLAPACWTLVWRPSGFRVPGLSSHLHLNSYLYNKLSLFYSSGGRSFGVLAQHHVEIWAHINISLLIYTFHFMLNSDKFHSSEKSHVWFLLFITIKKFFCHSAHV